MILLVHILLGAAIGYQIKNIYLAIILAFLSHYLMDLIPHIEYPINNVGKNWKKSLPQILNVGLDLFLGLFLVCFFVGFDLKVFVCAFFAIIPDGISLIGRLLPNNFFIMHNDFHQKKIHFLRVENTKKIPHFWRIASQVLVVIISIILLAD
jgi:hypothetical protein